MARPPSIQWNHKQWLGDNKVLAMDWDATAMHFHLLMMSIQEEPAGSIPNDVGQIRRWLRLPSGQSDSDRVWARVQPQIFAAWMLQDGRWFNPGMVATFERKEKYADRPQNHTGTIVVPKPSHNQGIEEVIVLEVDVVSKTSKAKPSLEEVETYCRARGNSVDPVQFFNFYEAKGWMIGKNSVKNWKACVHTWEGRGVQGDGKQQFSKKQQRTAGNQQTLVEEILGPEIGLSREGDELRTGGRRAAAVGASAGRLLD